MRHERDLSHILKKTGCKKQGGGAGGGGGGGAAGLTNCVHNGNHTIRKQSVLVLFLCIV